MVIAPENPIWDKYFTYMSTDFFSVVADSKNRNSIGPFFASYYW